MSTGHGLLASLRHRDFRRLMIAFTATSAGSWAYTVAMTVWIFDQTGSVGWVGAATIGRFVPALLFSAYGGVIAERFERVRLMVTIDTASAILMVGLAFLVAFDGPVAVAIVIAAVNSTIGTMYDPGVSAFIPQLVGERDLGAANALRNSVDSVAVIAGPGLGVLLLLLGQPWTAIAVNAVGFVLSALLIAGIRTRSIPVDVTSGGSAGALSQMLVGIRTIVGSRSAVVVVVFSLVATVIFGVDTVQLVAVSDQILGTGADGYGYLLAGLGIGGVLAAGLVSKLDARNRLGPVILGGLAVYCLPTLLFLLVSNPVAGFVIEIVRGAGSLVVNVLAITALQRSVSKDVLARVFGALSGLLLGAIMLGAFLAPIVIAGLGVTASLWLAGAVVPVACLAGLPALRGMDRRSAARRAMLAPRIEALARCRLFDSVADGPLEQMAGAATEIDFETGVRVVREGGESDAFFVILGGSFAVAAQGEAEKIVPLGVLGKGEYFGEIGLIERIPRTATVTAVETSRVLRVEAVDFLGALTQSAPSPALLNGASVRLGRTPPSLRLTRAAFSSGD